jgi:CheY-like chemotaxis protein
MELIGQLTGGVAHDFNNLLMAVLGNLDLIRKRFNHEPQLQRLVEGAMQGAQRGAALTQRLLAFARRQELTVAPVDLRRLLQDMTDLIERSIGSQIELRMKIPPRLAHVLVDANQIELAILNLVVNARDAMPDGGRLTIELSETNGESDLRGFVKLSVLDTGIGMDDITLQKATEPFFSTKELGKGTGLGLSMVHGLTKQLGGSLHLTSRPRHGTRAELLLPATNEAPTRHGNVMTPSSPAAARMSVLLVDDDVLICSSTAMMVEDLGHRVIETNKPEDALKILESKEQVDLLITDFSMPKINGVQLAAAARKLRPTLSIILATGYAELPSESSIEIPRISKPYMQDQLAVAIARATNNFPAANS